MNRNNRHVFGFRHCGIWLLVVALAGGVIYLLFPEFRPQILAALPFLLLLLCPLMHLFMHHDHGHQGNQGGVKPEEFHG